MADRAFDVGGDLIADTALHTGRWKRLLCLTDAAFAAGTDSDDISGAFTGQAIKAGTEITGSFSAIQLASGSVIALY
jgi:hypothetical protein